MAVQGETTTRLRETVLASRHRGLGARMVPFAGWSMPIQYEGVLAEHRAVRETCGIFDVGHMGTVFVRGVGASEFLQHTLTNDVDAAGVGRAQYTMLCNEAGGVVDDLIISHLAEDEWMIVPNASNVGTVVGVLRERAAEHGGAVVVDDVSDAWGIIAVQGPAYAVVASAAIGDDPPGRFAVRPFDADTGAGIVSGTGYTGSPGCEILGELDTITACWDAMAPALEDVGGAPAGLGARDVLRLEMGYALHGQDISPTISPIEANLGWVVKPEAGEFPGADVLMGQIEAGPPRRLLGLVTDSRRPPRAHNPVLDGSGRQVGEVTSGGFSPTLERGIALALVEADREPAEIDIRGAITPVKVHIGPFVDPPS